MLYIVSTPIGNLADFSSRGISCLSACDYVLCEDTRRSQRLLKHYQVEKPLKSFHVFNESQMEERIVQDLLAEKNIALLSDAGTPLIADPGYALIRRCIKEKIPISTLPGPCAAIVALVLSGFPPLPFQCIGFFPKKKGLRSSVKAALQYSGTTIAYESPHRICKTLRIFLEMSPDRVLCLARELTKIHEELLRGTPQELLERLPAPRGEFVMLVGPFVN